MSAIHCFDLKRHTNADHEYASLLERHAVMRRSCRRMIMGHGRLVA